MMFGFSKVTCDDIKFIPLESQSIKDLEKEYEKQSKYILDKINEKYSISIEPDRINLQRQQEFMDLKRRFLDPISERITQLAKNSPGFYVVIEIDRTHI